MKFIDFWQILGKNEKLQNFDFEKVAETFFHPTLENFLEVI